MADDHRRRPWFRYRRRLLMIAVLLLCLALGFLTRVRQQKQVIARLSRVAVCSNFYSVFDGLELLVMDASGKLLEQRPYTFHQSPFTSDGREFVLEPGKTDARLVFPMRSFGSARDAINVRFVGTLPGLAGSPLLSTDTASVAVSFIGLRKVEEQIVRETVQVREAPQLLGQWEYVLVSRKGRVDIEVRSARKTASHNGQLRSE